MTPQDRLNQMIEILVRFCNDFIARVTKSWKWTAAIAGVLVLGSAGFLVYALQDTKSRPVVEGAPVVETPTSTVNLLERALDGTLVNASSTHLLPLGVMVENSADAWPLQGPAKADLVFEAPVEGSITRFLLVFDASSTVPEIGPVRSARPYYVDWADGLDAMYVHVGGSPEAITKISGISGFRDLNELSNGWAFWRSAKRFAPHNVYTRPEILLQAAERKAFEPASFKAWTYTDATSTAEDATRITVPYAGYYEADWRYDKEADEYVRERNGSMITDADGTPIRVKNVVFIQSEQQVLDEIGRLRVRTTGRGKAWVFNGGAKREVEWRRTAGEHLSFTGIDGTDVLFRRGKTWVSVITDTSAWGRILE